MIVPRSIRARVLLGSVPTLLQMRGAILEDGRVLAFFADEPSDLLEARAEPASLGLAEPGLRSRSITLCS